MESETGPTQRPESSSSSLSSMESEILDYFNSAMSFSDSSSSDSSEETSDSSNDEVTDRIIQHLFLLQRIETPKIHNYI